MFFKYKIYFSCYVDINQDSSHTKTFDKVQVINEKYYIILIRVETRNFDLLNPQELVIVSFTKILAC